LKNQIINFDFLNFKHFLFFTIFSLSQKLTAHLDVNLIRWNWKSTQQKRLQWNANEMQKQHNKNCKFATSLWNFLQAIPKRFCRKFILSLKTFLSQFSSFIGQLSIFNLFLSIKFTFYHTQKTFLRAQLKSPIAVERMSFECDVLGVL
jgi:hypothetical protein